MTQHSKGIKDASPWDRRWRPWIASGLFAFTFLSILGTVTEPGFAWDEVFYIGGAENYRTWISRIGQDALKKEVLQEYWQANKEHPPLAKLAIAAAMTLGEPILGPFYSARLAIGFLFALLVVLVFLFMVWNFDLPAALLAALSLALMPQMFGHAHFAELDLPMALAWFASAATFSQAAQATPRWWALSGLTFGLALLTKINALMLPLILCPWGLFYFGRRAVPASLFLALGIPLFFAGWPWLWTDTIQHLQDYLLTVKYRTPIPVYYFWETYGRGLTTPFHYPVVMTLATLPAGTAVAAIVAAVKALRRFRTSKVEVLLVANAAFILFSASMPSVPKYDGVRLFLPAFPFIACLAGLGLRQAQPWLLERLKSARNAAWAFGLYFLWQAAGIAWMHPFYLSYYGGLVGGAAGAHRLFGMESTYWADVVDQKVVDFLIQRVPQGGTFVVFPYERLALDLVLKDQLKNFRPDISEGNFEEGRWDVAVLNCRQGLFDEAAWELYRKGQPAFAHRRQGVPLCLIFIKDQRPRDRLSGEADR